MLSDTEKGILAIIGERQLVRWDELSGLLIKNNINGEDIHIRNLKDKDLIEIVEPGGGKCFIITQKGFRTLRSMG